jgi:hypothetical protein
MHNFVKSFSKEEAKFIAIRCFPNNSAESLHMLKHVVVALSTIYMLADVNGAYVEFSAEDEYGYPV